MLKYKTIHLYIQNLLYFVANIHFCQHFQETRTYSLLFTKSLYVIDGDLHGLECILHQIIIVVLSENLQNATRLFT